MQTFPVSSLIPTAHGAPGVAGVGRDFDCKIEGGGIGAPGCFWRETLYSRNAKEAAEYLLFRAQRAGWRGAESVAVTEIRPAASGAS